MADPTDYDEEVSETEAKDGEPTSDKERSKQFVRFKAYMTQLGIGEIKQFEFFGISLSVPNLEPESTYSARCKELFDRIASPLPPPAPHEATRIQIFGVDFDVPNPKPESTYDARLRAIYERIQPPSRPAPHEAEGETTPDP